MATSQTDRLSRIVLTYEVDRASAQAAAKSAESIASGLSNLGIASDDLALKAKSLEVAFANIARARDLDKVAAQMAQARSQGASLDYVIGQASSELARLDASDAEINRLAAAFDRAEKEAREFAEAAAAGASATTSTGQSRSRAGGLASLGTQRGPLGIAGQQLFLLPDPQGMPFTEISRGLILIDAAQQAVAKAGLSFGQVATAGGLAGAALVGLIVVLGNFTSEVNRQKETIKSLIDLNRTFYEAQRTLTTEQARERLQQLQAERDAARQAVGDAQRALVASAQSFQDSFKTLFDVATLLPGGGQFGGQDLRNALGTAGSELFFGLAAQLTDAQKKLADAERAVGQYTTGIENNAFAAQDAAEAQRQLQEARIEGTRADAEEAQRFATQARDFSALTGEQADDRIRQFETENEGLKAAMEAISLSYGASTDMIRDAADRFFAEGQNDIEALRSALQAAGVPDDLIDTYLDYRNELRLNLDSIDQVKDAIREIITERELELETIRSTIRVLQEQAALQVQAVNLLQSGTVEQVDQRTVSLLAEQDALSRTIPQLQAMRATSEDAEKAFQDATNRIIGISAELKVLGAIRPDVAQRQYREEVEKLTASLVDDIHKIETARDNRIAQIEADLRVKEADLARDRDEALVEAEADAAEKRLDILEDFREQEAKINRKFDKDYLNAVANRDALAAFEAQQQREEDLQDLEQKLAKQNATVDKNLTKQQRTIEDRYDKQLRTAREAAARAIQQERDKAKAEIDLRTAAYTVEIQGLRNRLFTEFNLQNQFWAASIALAQRAVAAISQQPLPQIQIPNTVQLPATTSQQQAYAQFQAYQRSQGIPGFASGIDRVPRDMLAVIHRDEMVVPARQAQIVRENRTMGGVNVNVTVNGIGLNAAQVVRKVDQQLYETFRKVGVR